MCERRTLKTQTVLKPTKTALKILLRSPTMMLTQTAWRRSLVKKMTMTAKKTMGMIYNHNDENDDNDDCLVVEVDRKELLL